MDPAQPTWIPPSSHQRICPLIASASLGGIQVGNKYEKCLPYNNNACVPDVVLSSSHLLTDSSFRETL